MTLVLEILHPTPSLNLWVGRSKWVYRKTAKVRWLRYVHEAYLSAKAEAGRGRIWLTPPSCRVRVTVERYSIRKNALDVDNLYGGLKPLLDALRAVRLIDEDRHDAIDLHATQPKNPYRQPAGWTRVTLERLEEDRAA